MSKARNGFLTHARHVHHHTAATATEPRKANLHALHAAANMAQVFRKRPHAHAHAGHAPDGSDASLLSSSTVPPARARPASTIVEHHLPNVATVTPPR